MSTLADRVRRARDKWLAHPCTGAPARDANGGMVAPSSPDACRWCVIGALSAEGAFVGGYGAMLDVCGAAFDARVLVAPAEEGRLKKEHWDEAIVNLGGEP